MILHGIHFNMNKGFTLIELILYTAILSIVLSAFSLFAWDTINNGAKNNTEAEVFSQARFISERIKYEIRNASGINSVSANSISLSNFNSSLNPTVISLTSGNVQIKQGSSSTTSLNSPDMTISSLVFTNNSSVDNKTKNISFQFTLNSISSRQEFIETTTIKDSVEVRSN